MKLRTLIPLALLTTFFACGDKDTVEDDKPTRDSGSGTGDDGGVDGDSGTGDDGTGETGDDGGTGEDGGDDGTAAFRPAAGTWTYTGGNLLSDGCNTDEFGGGEPGASTFTLTNTGAETFVMKYETGDPWTCTLADQAFTCANLTGSAPVEDYDVTIMSNSAHLGSFDSETDFYGEFTVQVDCQGGDCGLAEWVYDLSFPCTVAFDATATFVE